MEIVRHISGNGTCTMLMEKSFHIAYVPFDERHTAQNIYKKLEEANLDWEIHNKVQLCLPIYSILNSTNSRKNRWNNIVDYLLFKI